MENLHLLGVGITSIYEARIVGNTSTASLVGVKKRGLHLVWWCAEEIDSKCEKKNISPT